MGQPAGDLVGNLGARPLGVLLPENRFDHAPRRAPHPEGDLQPFLRALPAQDLHHCTVGRLDHRSMIHEASIASGVPVSRPMAVSMTGTSPCSRFAISCRSASRGGTVDALAGWLEPSWRALREYTLGADWVHCDETRWPMLDGPGSCKWWTWCVASSDAAFYDIHRHRSAKAAAAVLNGFEGVLITDGYDAYSSLTRAGPGIRHAHCWAHVRRKFLEAEASYPDLAATPIRLIKQLFEVEGKLPKLPRGASLAERQEIRDVRRRAREEWSRPVIDELRNWGYETLPGLLPSTGMEKAVTYMLELWPGLTVFLDDPRVPVDNNHAERELRGVVVGRKNHYGSKSKRGTVVAAVFYSLFESARLAGVNPETYVLEAARRAIRSPGAVTLPHDLVS